MHNSPKLSLDNPHDMALKPSPLPQTLQWIMLGAFLLLVLVSGGYALTEHWRRAAFSLGVAMLWLAVARASCDSSVVGVFAVRSRRFDVLFSAGIGVLIVRLAISIDALGS